MSTPQPSVQPTEKGPKELFKFDSGLILQPPPTNVSANVSTDASEVRNPPVGKVWEGPSVAEGEIDKLLDALPVEGGELPKVAELQLQTQKEEKTETDAGKDKDPKEADELKLYTDDDKFRFIQLSCAGKRYTKSYSFMKDQISVTFRELSPFEDSLIIRQIAADSFADERSGSYQGVDAYFFSAEIYSMAVSIAEFSRPGLGAVTFPEASEVLAKFENPTGKAERYPFRELVSQITAKLFPTTTVQRLTLSRFREFRQMVLQLERHSLLENF